MHRYPGYDILFEREAIGLKMAKNQFHRAPFWSGISYMMPERKQE